MNNQVVYNVEIEDNKITAKHIEESIEFFKSILNKKPTNPVLNIIAKNEIIEFDYSFVGHLMLFKSFFKEHLRTDLNIFLYLPFNKIHTKDFDDDTEPYAKSIIWKLRQHMVHAYFSMDQSSVFSIIDGEGEIISAEFKRDSWFVLSRKFLPIMLINKGNYETIFERPMVHYPLNIKQEKQNKSITFEEELYQICRKQLFEKNKKDYNYIQLLSQLAFFGSLKKTRQLSNYLLKYSGLEENEKTKNEDFDIFKELYNKPPIYHLVFFTLTSSEILSIKEINKSKINNLWEFTKELVLC